MKILVTGATGFVGKHLVSRLINENYQCAVLVRDVEKAYSFFGDKVHIIKYDKDAFDYVDKIHSFNPEIVIHLASHYTAADDIKELQKLLEANVVFTSYLCSALERNKIQLFINTGSFAEYFDGNAIINPAYLYAATKTSVRYLIEYFGKKHNYSIIHVIPYSIYGEGGTGKKVIDYIIESLFSDSPIEMTEGKQILDFIHVEDVVDFYCTLIKKRNLISKPVSEYHLGTGIGTSIRDLSAIIENICGRKANIAWGKRQYRHCDVMHAVAPVAFIKKEFDWEAKVSIPQGIKRLIDFLGIMT